MRQFQFLTLKIALKKRSKYCVKSKCISFVLFFIRTTELCATLFVFEKIVRKSPSFLFRLVQHKSRKTKKLSLLFKL